MKITKLFALAAALSALSLNAEPVTLARTEAFELYQALNTLTAGLTPENTLAAADNINALEPDAKAYRMAATKVIQAQAKANAADATPADVAAFRKLDDDLAAKAEVRKTYQLSVLSISKEEIKSAGGLTPAQLATIRRLLKPDGNTDRKK